MTKETAYLTDRGVLRVAGVDAASFLQGIVTNDVERLHPGEARFCALLTPQGKILFDFFALRIVADEGAAYLLDCPAGQASDLVKRLLFYRLRAKVAIADESEDHGVIAFWGSEPENAPGAFVFADPREPRLGWRAILPRAKALAVGEASLAQYEALRIRLGVAKGGVDFAYGDAFPHETNMDLQHGVDFAKGCYVGQEVVSRMQHRGVSRKRVARVRLEGAAPAPGTAIFDGDLAVGALGSASGADALAMLRLDRAEEARAAGRRLLADGVAVALL